MKIFAALLTFTFVFMMTNLSSNAQTITNTNGTVIYTIDKIPYTLCKDTMLHEEGYKKLLDAYTNHAVRKNLKLQYLRIYDNQNQRTQGGMDRIVAQHMQNIPPEERAELYIPHSDDLSEDEFFKIYVLNATSVLNVLQEKLGTQNVQRLCQTTG